MLHTPLHRVLGERPGPITDQMINDAVAQQIVEDDLLDWKTELPPEKSFRESGIVKDIAAFANADGGILIFGITETEKVATGRIDAGELTENYERTIRQVCMTAITPPVFGVQSIAIPSSSGTRAVAIVIPASVDGPHLVYRNETFGAPLRTGADTHWMRERQLESAYRTRFEAAGRGEEAMQQIYEDMAAAADPVGTAVLVGVARPRSFRPRIDPVNSVSSLANQATLVSRWWLSGVKSKYGPLEDIEAYRERPTLAGRYLPPKNPGDRREAHAIILDDGSIGLSWRAGGQLHETTGQPYASHEIPTIAIEAFTAALVALVHAVATDTRSGDYEILLGVKLSGATGQQLEFHERNAAPPHGVHRPFSGSFRIVRINADPSPNDREFIQAAIDLATAALNQIGIKKPLILDPSLPPRPREWTW